ncbi:MAG TPA: hypothetical protein VGC42_12255 [Kofleriaceae bacterium]
MLLRRAVLWISTIGVAFLVALAVPVSQLRVISIIRECCCPDPDDCHCPDHKADPAGQSTMRACHSTERAVMAPQLPVFDPPEVALAPVTTVVAVVLAPALPDPHVAPPPTRPDAPS